MAKEKKLSIIEGYLLLFVRAVKFYVLTNAINNAGGRLF